MMKEKDICASLRLIFNVSSITKSALCLLGGQFGVFWSAGSGSGSARYSKINIKVQYHLRRNFTFCFQVLSQLWSTVSHPVPILNTWVKNLDVKLNPPEGKKYLKLPL